MIGRISASNKLRTSSELAPNMFGDSSELASVMEFGFKCPLGETFLSRLSAAVLNVEINSEPATKPNKTCRREKSPTQRRRQLSNGIKNIRAFCARLEISTVKFIRCMCRVIWSSGHSERRERRRYDTAVIASSLLRSDDALQLSLQAQNVITSLYRRRVGTETSYGCLVYLLSIPYGFCRSNQSTL